MDKALDGEKRQLLVAEVLKQLKPNQRKILELKFKQDFSYHQISKLTGYSATHVGVLIHNTIKEIRKLMVEHAQQVEGKFSRDG